MSLVRPSTLLLSPRAHEAHADRRGTRFSYTFYYPERPPSTTAPVRLSRTTPAPDEAVVLIANGSPHATEARVFLPYSYLFDQLPLVDLLGGREVLRVEAGRVDVRLGPWEVLVLAPDDAAIPGYRFFRPR